MNNINTRIKEKVELFFTDHVSRISCYVSDLFFLMLFLFYALFFGFRHANILMYSAASTGLVALTICPILIWRHKIYAYISIIYHITLFYYITFYICMGWGYGISGVLSAFIVCIFTAGYLSKKMLKRNFHPVLKSSLVVIVCLWFSFSKQFYTPIYKEYVTEWETVNMTFGHIFVSLPMILFFLYIITKHALLLEDQLYTESITDRLTNIYNRRGLLLEFQNVKLDDYSNYLVTIFDIDNFKKFNDRFGHNCGDAVLKQISQMLFDFSDISIDRFCRWGGEEFVMITRIREDVDKTRNIIDSFRDMVDKKVFICEDLELHVSITMGTKIYSDYTSIEQWIDAADNNLYIGKNSGKNCLTID